MKPAKDNDNSDSEESEQADEEETQFSKVKLATPFAAVMTETHILHSTQNTRQPGQVGAMQIMLPESHTIKQFLVKVMESYPAYIDVPKDASTNMDMNGQSLMEFLLDLAELQIFIV